MNLFTLLSSYKELEINVFNTTWDLMLKMAYSDNKCNSNGNVAVSEWDSRFVKATYTDGIINDPNSNGIGSIALVDNLLSFKANI